MSQTVPLADVPSQLVQVQLGGQACEIAVYQEATGLFCDVSVNNAPAPLIAGVICENLNRIVRSLYLGFIGDFVFVDTAGSSDPSWPGLGSRYQLVYLTPADLGGRG